MRIFLASLMSGMNEQDRKEAIKKAEPLYFLETFFNGEKTCKKVLEIAGKENFLLDSGAFSYMNGANCSKKQLIVYLEKYIKFINDNDVKYFFELDVDTIFGIEFVEYMRKKLESETKKKCIPVWHKGRGVEYWKKMCDNYDYIAIGGLVFHVKKQEYESIKKMVHYARKKGVKVHGLGFTKTKELQNYDFYSVDSTSWKMSAIMGNQITTFKNGQLYNRPLNKQGKKIIMSKLIQHNFIEWVKYQKYMNKKRW